MRWFWLRAAIAALVIGPAPVVADPVDEEPADAEQLQPEKRSGHVVQGPRFYVWEEDSREAADWARELGQPVPWIGADDWAAVAARTASQPPIRVEDEVELATRLAASAGDADISPLGLLLCLLPSLDRTCLVSTWATSPDERTRAALARALSAPFDAVGVRGALDHLQGDPSTEVRRLAAAAAAVRRSPQGGADALS